MQEPGRELGVECLDRGLEEAGSEGREARRLQGWQLEREGKWVREHGRVVVGERQIDTEMELLEWNGQSKSLG